MTTTDQAATKFTSLDELQSYLKTFAKDRDWEQFQSPKNLAMALSVEASELLELFQWLSETESRQLSDSQKQQAGYEMADVLMYLLRMADVLGVDLLSCCTSKSRLNEKRFPVDAVKGKRLLD